MEVDEANNSETIPSDAMPDEEMHVVSEIDAPEQDAASGDEPRASIEEPADPEAEYSTETPFNELQSFSHNDRDQNDSMDINQEELATDDLSDHDEKPHETENSSEDPAQPIEENPPQPNGQLEETAPHQPAEQPEITENIWVETKSPDGKPYYYHATSRETTWTKPEGPNVKIMTQEMIEKMAMGNADTGDAKEGAIPGLEGGQNAVTVDATTTSEPASAVQPVMPQQAPMMYPGWGAPPPTTGTFPGPYPGGYPPMFPPQYPPPTYGYGPWGMPPMGIMDSTYCKPPPTPEELSKIDPKIVARAADWAEYRTPDGRPYYYNTKRQESVWEKPAALKDLETARLAAAQGISTVPTPTIETPGRRSKFDIPHPMQQVPQVQLKPPPQQQLPNKKPLMADLKISSATEEVVANGKAEAMKRAEQEAAAAAAAAKSKEEEEKPKLVSATEVKKPQDRGRPVTSTPVSGTPWCVVWTGDGRVFFYNPSTRTSVWERPDELIGRPDVDKLVTTPPDVVLEMSGGSGPLGNSGVKRQDVSGMSEASPAKRMKEDSGALGVSKSGESGGKSDATKEAAIEAEVRAARERQLVPLETRIKSFRDMLAEKDVSAFSTWEKELHKIVFDPRYLLLTSKERKQVFEKYVKERADEERREKRNKMKQRRDDFKALMESANLHSKSSYAEFAAKYGRDERFRNIEKLRERESLFNEFILDVRKKEKEEKMAKRDQVKKDFLQLLKEHSEIDRHSRYSEIKKKISSDPRYKAVDSGSLREDWFRDYIKILKDERKKDKKDKEKKDKKRDKKDKAEKKDSFNDSLAKSGDENAFVNDDTETTQNKTDWSDDESKKAKISENEGDDMEANEENEKEREKQLRMEASLREREKEVQRTLASHLRDRDKEREQHKKDEAIQHFNALLTDLIRNADHSWREAKKIMRKDHRWELAESLERDEREKLFNAHIEQLLTKKREKFRELLAEVPTLSFESSWKEVKKLIKEDPRYVKFSSSDRKMEREFKEYLKDKLLTAKTDFRQLLQETKLISHNSKKLIQENEQHLLDIEEILKKDKRYLVLDHIPEERRHLLLMFLEELEKRGPPPPPTASEPNRRNK